MKKKVSGLGIFIIVLILIIFLLFIANKGINFYNTHSKISLDVQQVQEIYSEYDLLINEMAEIIDGLCTFDNTESCKLNPSFENLQSGDRNSILNKIVRFIKSTKRMLYIDKKASTFKLSEDETFFRYGEAKRHDFLNGFTNCNDEVALSNYVSNIISVSVINGISQWEFSQNNILININGKRFIYNDYIITLKNELELTKILFNILRYLVSTI